VTPERVGVGKDAMLAKEVGGDRPVIGLKVKERLVGGDGGAARDPVPAGSAHGGVLVFVLIKPEPFGLLV